MPQPQQRQFKPAPDILPANFQQWDSQSAPDTLPKDFNFQSTSGIGAPKPANSIEENDKRWYESQPGHGPGSWDNRQHNPNAILGRGDTAENLAGYMETGPGEMAGGAGDVARGNVKHGLNRMFSGAGTTALPAMPFLAGGAPLATARAIGGGYVTGKAAETGTRLFGGDDESQELASNIGNLVGGGVAASGLPRALLQTPAKNFLAAHGDTLLKMIHPKATLEDFIKTTVKGAAPGTTELPIQSVSRNEIRGPYKPYEGDLTVQGTGTEAGPVTGDPAPAVVPRTSAWPPERPSAIQPREFRGPADSLEDKGFQEANRQDLENHGRQAYSQNKREWFARNVPGSSKGDLVAKGAPKEFQLPDQVAADTERGIKAPQKRTFMRTSDADVKDFYSYRSDQLRGEIQDAQAAGDTQGLADAQRRMAQLDEIQRSHPRTVNEAPQVPTDENMESLLMKSIQRAKKGKTFGAKAGDD